MISIDIRDKAYGSLLAYLKDQAIIPRVGDSIIIKGGDCYTVVKILWEYPEYGNETLVTVTVEPK